MAKSSDGCQTNSGDSAPVRAPWRGTAREAEKEKLAQYVLYNPSSAPLSKITQDVFGSDAVESAGADYQLARRFFERQDCFKTERRDGFVWVEPQEWALLLKSSRQNSADGDVTVDLSKVPGTLPSRAPAGRAAQTARTILRDRCEITPGQQGARVRAALTHALAAHREGVDSAGMRPDRVSDPSRVAARQGEYLGAFKTAACRHRQGALVTLTARPGESGDMVDTAVAVSESVGPLRDHLRRQTPGPGRPPAIVAYEITNRGVLHLHTLVFGVGPVDFDRDDLCQYWHETRGHGYVMDLAPVDRRPSQTSGRQRFQWVFGDHADAETTRGRYVRAYLGETLFRFREVAEATADEIHAHAAAEADRGHGGEWWKVALLWACGLSVTSISKSLRQPSTTPNNLKTV